MTVKCLIKYPSSDSACLDWSLAVFKWVREIESAHNTNPDNSLLKTHLCCESYRTPQAWKCLCLLATNSLSLLWCHPLQAPCSATADTTKLQTVTEAAAVERYRAAGSGWGSDKVWVWCGWEKVDVLWAKPQLCDWFILQKCSGIRERKVCLCASLSVHSSVLLGEVKDKMILSFT